MLDEMYDDLDQTLTAEDLFDATAPLDVDGINRRLRAIARRRRALADAEQIAQAEIDKTLTWLDEQRSKFSTAHLEAQLADYHRARLADDPRLKTISLPAGDLVARATQPEWAIDDDEFLGWAAVHRPELVRSGKVSVDRLAAKKAFHVLDDGRAVDPETGEQVPGVTVTPGGTSYSVKINTGEHEAF